MLLWGNIVRQWRMRLEYLAWLCTCAGAHTWRKKQAIVCLVKLKQGVIRSLTAPDFDQTPHWSSSSNFVMGKPWSPHTHFFNWTKHNTACFRYSHMGTTTRTHQSHPSMYRYITPKWQTQISTSLVVMTFCTFSFNHP